MQCKTSCSCCIIIIQNTVIEHWNTLKKLRTLHWFWSLALVSLSLQIARANHDTWKWLWFWNYSKQWRLQSARFYKSSNNWIAYLNNSHLLAFNIMQPCTVSLLLTTVCLTTATATHRPSTSMYWILKTNVPVTEPEFSVGNGKL